MTGVNIVDGLQAKNDQQIGGVHIDYKHSAFLDFANYLGGAALIQAVNKTVFAPFERLKIIHQAQNALFINEKARFKNIIDYISRVPKEQGFKAFYRGNFANIMYIVPRSIAQFAFIENINETLFPEGERNLSNVEYGARKFAAAIASGFFTLLLAYPFDLVKTRLSLEFAKAPYDRQFKGILSTIGVTKEKAGFSGLYRGFLLANATNIPYFWTLFTSLHAFQNIDKSVIESNKQLFEYVAPASMAGLVATIATYPLDTLKRRIQINGYSPNLMYKSTFDCLQKILDKEGFFALYKGLTITTFKFTGSAALQTVLLSQFIQLKQKAATAF